MSAGPNVIAFPGSLNGYPVRAFLPAPRYAADAFCVVVFRWNEFVTAYWRPGFGEVWSHGHYGFQTEAEALADAIQRAGITAGMSP